MKYKKLDNLDDLRVGDVILSTTGAEYEILKIDGNILYLDRSNEVWVCARQRITIWEYTAKRPLPEKKEKVGEWHPKMDEQYFFPRFHDQISGYVAQTTWDGGEWDRNLMKLSMVFRTRRECEEAALKMIKAINQ